MASSCPVRRRLAERIVVCDGAMGSELLSRLPPGATLDLATMEHPRQVLEVHLAYLEAGAEILETARGCPAPSRLSIPFGTNDADAGGNA